MNKDKLWILILAIFSFVFVSFVLAIIVVYFGYKNKKNSNAKIGMYIGIAVLLLVIFIKFIFPIIMGVSSPFMIYESCSMYHFEKGFDKILESEIYSDNSISLQDTEDWSFQNGVNRGDILVVFGTDAFEVGDIMVFNSGAQHPLGHRVIRIGETYGTKGDNYKTNAVQLISEKEISNDQIIGKVVFKIPLLGWQKLIFYQGGRNPRDRWLCK